MKRGLLVALALLLTTPAEAADIAFTLRGQDGGELAFVRPDGGARRAVTRLAPRGIESGSPAWRPDGGQLAFVRYQGPEEAETSSIWTVRANGGEARRLTSREGQTYEPAFSPDGRRIAFSRAVPTGDEVVTSLFGMGAGGGALTRLTTGEFDSDAAWSPDGARIAFTRYGFDDGGVSSSLVLLHLATGTESVLVGDGAGPAWSPDGRTILFTSSRDRNGTTCFHDCTYNRELYLIGVDGTGERRLTFTTADEASPAWTADGERILVASDAASPETYNDEIYALDADGTCPVQLTNSSSEARDPAPSPALRGSELPRACGARVPAAVTPKVDTPVWRAYGFRDFPLWFAGRELQGALLVHVAGGRRAWSFIYGDCGRASPGDCLGAFEIHVRSSCARHPLRFRGLRPVYSRRRGVLVADYGRDSGWDVHTGGATVTLFGPRRAQTAALAALRRVGPKVPSTRLLPSALPAAVVDSALRPRTAAERRLGRALARFGSVRRLDCP